MSNLTNRKMRLPLCHDTLRMVRLTSPASASSLTSSVNGVRTEDVATQSASPERVLVTWRSMARTRHSSQPDKSSRKGTGSQRLTISVKELPIILLVLTFCHFLALAACLTPLVLSFRHLHE